MGWWLTLSWCHMSNLKEYHLPVSFGLHDIRTLSSQLLQPLFDNRFLLVLVLLKHNGIGCNAKLTQKNHAHRFPQYAYLW